ncbi:hypothetical protein PAEPH01_1025 [Pancytospora epiphaga]|nr:hypothetical protein PAEPH01_1025 [Pancytospora epiphaga]
MLFVQLGREVVPRDSALRKHRAVIVGIKDDKFVVIQKQDKTKEMIRLKDVVLVDKVYDLEELNSASCDFYKVEEEASATNDFERFVISLQERVARDIIKEKGF